MSIYTEEAERRSKECKRHLKGFDGVCAKCNPAPRLVAECWTCAPLCRIDDPDCCEYCESGEGYRKSINGELRHVINLDSDGVQRHRAAGHDVREVKR